MMPPEVEGMVSKLRLENGSAYICEICGYGYKGIETAENCEQHCDTQMQPSPKIRQKAIYHPRVEILSASQI